MLNNFRLDYHIESGKGNFMSTAAKIKSEKAVRIGLYSVGLKAYWSQFSGLLDCLMFYNSFIGTRLSAFGEVHNFGMVDTPQEGEKAGEYFLEKNVDIIFLHAATYCTSACVLPVHQICHAPVVILNLQPAAEMAYDTTTTGQWLAQCVGCPVPEVANAFGRAQIPFRTVSGLLGLSETPSFSASDENTAERPEAAAAWQEIREWCMAARVKANLQNARFGFLGGYYSGMLDMYSDFTMLQAQAGIQVEILEMCDLEKYLQQVSREETDRKRKEVEDFFTISGDSPSDPIARRPDEEQLEWSCRVACAQEKMVTDRGLDCLAYYYHGQEGGYYEKIQSGFIVGHSLLTAKGIPCAGEGDIKTALAMKICDILGCGGSFSEIIAADFNRNTMILGHDGPFHLAIAREKPVLRGMGVYHGKKGSGISVEAKVRSGDVTTLGITQTRDGNLGMIVSEGVSTDGPTLMNGNTSTHVRFRMKPAEYMDRWFAEAPTHHCALSIGKNAELFKKVAWIMNIRTAILE